MKEYRKRHPEKWSVGATRTIRQRYYRRHRARILAVDWLGRQAVTQIIRRAKAKPCADCRQSYPYYIMDFDHIRGQKVAALSLVARWKNSLPLLYAEIAKCDVVCANCHREREQQRRAARQNLKVADGLQHQLHAEMQQAMTQVPKAFTVPLLVEGEYGLNLAETVKL